MDVNYYAKGEMWSGVREEEIALIILMGVWVYIYEMKWKPKRGQSATVMVQVMMITVWTKSLIPLAVIFMIQLCQMYNVYNGVRRSKNNIDGVYLVMVVVMTLFAERRVAQTVVAIVMRHLIIHGNVMNQLQHESLVFLTDPCCCAGSWSCLSTKKNRENIN